MLKADAARGRWDMMLGITGVALVSSSLVPDDAGLPMVSGGLSLMIVAALVGLWRGQRAWQRIWPVIAGLMVAGLPWGVSTWLSLGLLSSLMEGKNVGLAIGGWLGLVLLVVGIARMVMGRESSLRGRTELPEAMREAGKLVLVFTSAVIAQGMKGLGGAYAWVGFGAVGVVASLAVLGFRRLPASVVRRMNTLGTWVVGDGVQETLKVGANRVLRWSRAVVGTLEGEGGMLWVYVVLLFVVMAIGGG